MRLRIGRRSLSLVLAVLLSAAVGAAPALAASGTDKCQAQDLTQQGAVNTNLAAVIAAAQSGDTIQVQGTCTLVNQSIDIALTITGKSTKVAPTPTITAGGAGQVIIVGYDAAVTLKSLTIKGGVNTTNPDFGGGAIENLGILTIVGSRLVGNTGAYGGAIETLGTLTITDTKINDNHALYQGGAIENLRGTLTVSGTTKGSSAIAGNTSGGYSGAIDNYDTVVLDGYTTVSNNTAVLDGGAIDSTGSVSLSGRAAITGNTAGYNGGGIAAAAGSVSLAGNATITGNTADTLLLGNTGGGIWAACDVVLTGVTPTNVKGNTPDDVSDC